MRIYICKSSQNTIRSGIIESKCERGYRTMKKNKLTKILVYSVCSLVITGVIFLAVSYFGKEEEVQKNDLSQNTQKQEQVNRSRDSEDNNKLEKKQEQKTKNTE